jgi:hypothetical protein
MSFRSHSPDGDEHREGVLALTERLRADDIETARHHASADAALAGRKVRGGVSKDER